MKGYQFAQFFRDAFGYRREKIDQSRGKEFIESIVMAKKIAENGNQKEAQRYDCHHGKI
jgi:hypothetical protein